MSDRIFFPLMLLVASIMVIIAMNSGTTKLPSGPIGGANTDYTIITVEGIQLNRIVASKDTTIELAKSGDDYVIRIEALAGMLNEDPSKGPHFLIDSDLEWVFSDHEIEVSIVARPADRKGASAFQANYSVGRAGESGWQTFDMFPEWREYSFIYRVPEKKGENAFDYLGLRPVVPEDFRVMEIKRIKFKRFVKRQSGDDA